MYYWMTSTFSSIKTECHWDYNVTFRGQRENITEVTM